MKNISFALLSLIVGSALSFAAETLRPGEVAKIGVDPAYMTWGQVNALVKRGCELGAMVSHNPVRDRGHRAEISEIDAALALVEKKTGRAPKAALYVWPGMTGEMRADLDRRGIAHQVWRGGQLNGEKRACAELSNVCARAASGIHSTLIFPFGPSSASEIDRSQADLRAAARALGSATNVWFAKLSERRARETAYTRYLDRKAHEKKLLDGYADRAFQVSVAGPGWGVPRKPGEKVTFTVRFAAPDAETAPLLAGLAATVTVDNFGSRRQFEKTVPLRSDSEVVCSGTLREPGFLRIRIEAPGFLPNQGRPWQRSVPFAPERIAKVGACPADFDAFWAKAVREAEKIPLARPQVCLDRDGVQRPSLRVGRQAVLDRERVVRLRRPRAGGAGEKEFALSGHRELCLQDLQARPLRHRPVRLDMPAPYGLRGLQRLPLARQGHRAHDRQPRRSGERRVLLQVAGGVVQRAEAGMETAGCGGMSRGRSGDGDRIGGERVGCFLEIVVEPCQSDPATRA